MDLGIKGKKAIVCASSRGLGKACALSLAKAGVRVVINGINKDNIKKTAEEIADITSSKPDCVVADITYSEGQEKLLAACPNPDILVNNAGGPPLKDFRTLNETDIQNGLRMNMVSPIILIQKVIDRMVERKFGRIVNITSISVKMPISGLDLSSGARAGLTSFLSGVSRQFAHANITINQLMPGFFDTDRYFQTVESLAKQLNISNEEAHKLRINDIPAKRVGKPSEFGDFCAFLCSENAGYITGQNILLDGGRFASAF